MISLKNMVSFIFRRFVLSKRLIHSRKCSRCHALWTGNFTEAYDPKLLRNFYAYYITRTKEVASKGSGEATFTPLSCLNLCGYRHSGCEETRFILDPDG
jgi:hypothetical protein